MTTGDDVRLVARTCRATLEPLAGADWQRQACDLEWSCRTTLTHILSALSYYATNLALQTEQPRSGGQANEEMEVTDMLDALEGRAEVLALVCETAPEHARGAQTYGRSDPAGFAAMACDEMLIHTADIAAGFGAAFEPPHDVCERVLNRLFPWAPESEADAWATLLWANGRAPLGDHPRLEPDWVWLSVPLEEWNGEDPNR